MDQSLLPFFAPKGVVVVGVSTNSVKPGYGAARNLVDSGYRGKINFVSQKPGELFGRPIYASLADVPDPLDLAVIVVPAVSAAASLEECGKRGVRAAIVLTGGFREMGPDGAALEAELMRVARAYGMRIIGPNCVGLIDAHFPLDTSFLPPPLPPSGDVAVVSQSGAMMSIMIDWARTEQVGFSRMMSLGNKADVDEPDVLEAAIEQEQTRLLVMYIEALTNGKRFIEEARKVARKKPVVALKVGRGEAGQKAASSHTGALAGSDTAYQAAFERAGILRAANTDELFDWMSAFTRCPLPAGNRVAILTNAGGPGVVASDTIEACWMRLAELSQPTLEALRAFLPAAASIHNPLDMLASASPQHYGQSLRLLLADPGVDAVIVLLPAPPLFDALEVADEMIPLIKASGKPVVVSLLGQKRLAEAHERLRHARVAVYTSTERGVAALAGLVRRSEIERMAEPQYPQFSGIERDAAQAALDGSTPGAWLDPAAAERLVAAYGIPTAPIRLVTTPEAAAACASELGFPVAVKVASPDISHKSDVGGVLLGVTSAEAAAQAFQTVTRNARHANPRAQIEGAHIQRMIPAGQEVIIGATRDAIFGPLMMFGSGGVEVEGLKDVTFELAPLAGVHTSAMLARTWAGRKLGGFRSIPSADAGAVRDALMRLAQLALDWPQVAEIEINPLRVFAPGQGAVALDVRIRL